jgi:hypothetical protein
MLIVSREWAETLSTVANISLIASLAIGVISTVIISWMGHIKEEYLKRDLAEADEKIALANAAGEQAKKEAAEANQRAVQAALDLAKFRAPRMIGTEQGIAIVGKLKDFEGQTYTGVLASSGFDIASLWARIDQLLQQARWVRGAPAGLSVGHPPAGVAVQADNGVTVAFKREAVDTAGIAAEALVKALLEAGITAQLGYIGDPKEKRHNVVTIRVGAKPQ